jgi:hypothetical protein
MIYQKEVQTGQDKEEGAGRATTLRQKDEIGKPGTNIICEKGDIELY